MTTVKSITTAISLLTLSLSGLAHAQATTAFENNTAVPEIQLPAPNLEHIANAALNDNPGVIRFATAISSDITETSSAYWQLVGQQWQWRLAIHSPGAVSLHLRFSQLQLPEAATLSISTPDGSISQGPWSAADQPKTGDFWTPIIPGDTLVLHASIPQAQKANFGINISEVWYGYHDAFNTNSANAARSKEHGACNVDVACAAGDSYGDQIRAVARIQVAGFLCSAVLLNNTAANDSPLLLTANHCISNASEASTVVAYWNYETNSCNGAEPGNPSFAQSQSGGADLLATWAPTQGSDFSLLRLRTQPLPTHNVFYAGWDRSASAPSSAFGIHHPGGDAKAISIENDALEISGGVPSPSTGVVIQDNNYLLVNDWDLGTTEGGSSGSGLFNPQRRVIGQLSHGSAQCGGSAPNSNTGQDYYGRLSKAWLGGGCPDACLRSHLDPNNSGLTVVNGKNPGVNTGGGDDDNTGDDNGNDSGNDNSNTGGNTGGNNDEGGGGSVALFWLFLLGGLSGAFTGFGRTLQSTAFSKINHRRS